MPKGRVVRQDDMTSESLKVMAAKKLDRDLLNAMTGEEGPLPPGLLPAVKATGNGGQKLFEALDDEKRKVNKQANPKKKAQANEAAEVEPKTTLQWGPPMALGCGVFLRFVPPNCYFKLSSWISDCSCSMTYTWQKHQSN